jgi:predicted esterase
VKKTIRFEYEAHYSLSHEPSYQEKEIWLVLHGYGQLAEFFVRKFKDFSSPDRLFIAPEGTNYAYLAGFQGRVGANWMTRHEREIAIENNHRFLDKLMDTILSQYTEKPQIRALGFSQGAATLTRWASRWKEELHTLVLWAGGFALDMELDKGREKFQNTDLILVLGDRDELITAESLQKQEELIGQLKKEIVRHSFPGGHELDSDLLHKIINQQI